VARASGAAAAAAGAAAGRDAAAERHPELLDREADEVAACSRPAIAPATIAARSPVGRPPAAQASRRDARTLGPSGL
jgi:hypothetical protein